MEIASLFGLEKGGAPVGRAATQKEAEIGGPRFDEVYEEGDRPLDAESGEADIDDRSAGASVQHRGDAGSTTKKARDPENRGPEARDADSRESENKDGASAGLSLPSAAPDIAATKSATAALDDAADAKGVDGAATARPAIVDGGAEDYRPTTPAEAARPIVAAARSDVAATPREDASSAATPAPQGEARRGADGLPSTASDTAVRNAALRQDADGVAAARKSAAQDVEPRVAAGTQADGDPVGQQSAVSDPANARSAAANDEAQTPFSVRDGGALEPETEPRVEARAGAANRPAAEQSAGEELASPRGAEADAPPVASGAAATGGAATVSNPSSAAATEAAGLADIAAEDARPTERRESRPGERAQTEERVGPSAPDRAAAYAASGDASSDGNGAESHPGGGQNLQGAANSAPAFSEAGAGFSDTLEASPLQPGASGTAPGAVARADAATAAPQSAAARGASVADQIGAAVLSRGDDRRIMLQLDPQELGRVSIELTFADDALSVSVRAERAEALDLMRRNAADLERQLREAGLDFDSLSFGAENGREQSGEEQRFASAARDGFAYRGEARLSAEAMGASPQASTLTGRSSDSWASGVDLRV